MDALEHHVARQIEHSRDFFWHRVRWAAVSAYLPREGSFAVIDVGAGAGLLGMFMARDRPNGRYLFVEPIPALERHLEELYGATANARRLESYAAGDFLTVLDVLEHQADDRAFMSEFVNRMEAGARLILTVPALMQLWSNWDESLGHYRRYDKRALAKVIQGLPLRTVEMSYLFPEMLPLGLLRRFTRRGPVKAATKAEFPDLPRPLNDLLTGVGRALLPARRLWPAGTSILAVLERT